MAFNTFPCPGPGFGQPRQNFVPNPPFGPNAFQTDVRNVPPPPRFPMVGGPGAPGPTNPGYPGNVDPRMPITQPRVGPSAMPPQDSGFWRGGEPVAGDWAQQQLRTDGRHQERAIPRQLDTSRPMERDLPGQLDRFLSQGRELRSTEESRQKEVVRDRRYSPEARAERVQGTSRGGDFNDALERRKRSYDDAGEARSLDTRKRGVDVDSLFRDGGKRDRSYDRDRGHRDVEEPSGSKRKRVDSRLSPTTYDRDVARGDRYQEVDRGDDHRGVFVERVVDPATSSFESSRQEANRDSSRSGATLSMRVAEIFGYDISQSSPRGRNDSPPRRSPRRGDDDIYRRSPPRLSPPRRSSPRRSPPRISPQRRSPMRRSPDSYRRSPERRYRDERSPNERDSYRESPERQPLRSRDRRSPRRSPESKSSYRSPERRLALEKYSKAYDDYRKDQRSPDRRSPDRTHHSRSYYRRSPEFSSSHRRASDSRPSHYDSPSRRSPNQGSSFHRSLSRRSRSYDRQSPHRSQRRSSPDNRSRRLANKSGDRRSPRRSFTPESYTSHRHESLSHRRSPDRRYKDSKYDPVSPREDHRHSPHRYSPPRRSPSRHSPHRRSPPRRSPPRYSPTRRSPPRHSPSRRSPNRYSPPRRSPPRRSPPRRSPPRRSPTRHSLSRRSPQRQTSLDRISSSSESLSRGRSVEPSSERIGAIVDAVMWSCKQCKQSNHYSRKICCKCGRSAHTHARDPADGIPNIDFFPPDASRPGNRPEDLVKRVHVSNLHPATTAQDLMLYFSRWGNIVHTNIITNRQRRLPFQGQNKSFGFVSFSKASEAAAVLADNHTLFGCPLQINPVKLSENFEDRFADLYEVISSDEENTDIAKCDGRKYQCAVQYCGFIGMSFQFSNHWQEMHLSYRKYLICPVCDTACTDRREMRGHLMYAHGVTDVGRSLESILKNVKNEGRRNPHFLDPGSIQKEGRFEIRDNECMKTIDPFKVYKCPVDACPFSASAVPFIRHWSAKHLESARSFTCPVCTILFKHKTSLVDHFRMGHGVDVSGRPYNRHIIGAERISSDEDEEEFPPAALYGCKVKDCTYKGEKMTFKRHWRDKHEMMEQYLACPYCGYGCPDQPGLRYHMLSEHRVKTDDPILDDALTRTFTKERLNTNYMDPGSVEVEGKVKIERKSIGEHSKRKPGTLKKLRNLVSDDKKISAKSVKGRDASKTQAGKPPNFVLMKYNQKNKESIKAFLDWSDKLMEKLEESHHEARSKLATLEEEARQKEERVKASQKEQANKKHPLKSILKNNPSKTSNEHGKEQQLSTIDKETKVEKMEANDEKKETNDEMEDPKVEKEDVKDEKEAFFEGETAMIENEAKVEDEDEDEDTVEEAIVEEEAKDEDEEAIVEDEEAMVEKEEAMVEDEEAMVEDDDKEEAMVEDDDKEEAMVEEEAMDEKEEAMVEHEEAMVEEAKSEKKEAMVGETKIKKEAAIVETGEAIVEKGEANVEKEEAIDEKGEADVEKGDAKVEKEEATVEKGEATVEKGEARVEKGEANVEKEAIVEKGEAEVEKGDANVEKEEAIVEKGDANVEKEEVIVEKEEAKVEKEEANVEKEAIVEKGEAEVEKEEEKFEEENNIADMASDKTSHEEVVAPSNEMIATNECGAPSDKVVAISDVIAATSDEVAAANDKIVATSDEVATTSDEVAATSDEVAATSDEVAATSDEVAATSHEVAATSVEDLTTKNTESSPVEKTKTGPVGKKSIVGKTVPKPVVLKTISTRTSVRPQRAKRSRR